MPLLQRRRRRWILTSSLIGLILGSTCYSELALSFPPATSSKPAVSPLMPNFAQQMLDWALESPLYKLLLVPQARRTMVATAEANGIAWESAKEWIESKGPWDDSVIRKLCTAQSDDQLEAASAPEYYCKPFHAYESGNLNWQAAFEQELASRAVGARNFPKYGEQGEEAFRGAFDKALVLLGAAVPDSGVVVDMGCGTGTSTRRLATQFPKASRFLGLDLSPYFIAVGQKLLELAPGPTDPWVTTVEADQRVELRVADATRTNLPDNSVDTVNLCLVIHELPPSVARYACDEALRILKPNGQLWISEMDFSAPAYAELRSNALLFSLIRATEPYLDEYADSAESLFDYLVSDNSFANVRITGATGRHFALVATKGDKTKNMVQKGVKDDRRFDLDGNYVVEDTHLKTWESKS
eukprot:TRINITY_DN63286_c0_g1_i1.p1 TRINITY_DN63286_c0_g1~~TRINITY_DN63286_c0_g1_i1.p1  ORF type:complete len:413 (+),score=63.16 TRINITY_DN63286_c0_g1_i1:73-1311(+)